MIIFGLVVAAGLSCLSLLYVSAQDNALSDTQVSKIKSNCISTKNTLNQLHTSDALLRVNRGQIYELIQTKLMDKFNERLASNKLGGENFKTITTNYGTALDGFRQDYKLYEEQLSSAIAIDCDVHPIAFYDAIKSARTQREAVYADIKYLNQFIDQYQSVLSQFDKDYKAASKGVSR